MEWGGPALPCAKHLRDTGRQKSTVKHSQLFLSVSHLKELENEAAQMPRHRIAHGVQQGHPARDRGECAAPELTAQRWQSRRAQHGKGHHSQVPISLLSSCSTIYRSFARHRLVPASLLHTHRLVSPYGDLELDLVQLHPGLTSY